VRARNARRIQPVEREKTMAEKEGDGQISTRITQDGQYRLLVEAITDYAIYMLDPKGTVKSWNPGAERFKGYQAAEILGKHFSMFYTLEDRANGEPERAMETATREGRFESEGWRVRKDGSRFWASVVLEPIRAGDGQIVGFAKITRDITRQKETQLALDQAKLALFQSQKMDAIGQLTGGVAHDFNNLLTAILASLDLAHKRLPNDGKLVALIDNAIQAARRGTSLTRRMLAFARHHELNAESIDVSSLVHGMTDLLQSSVGPSVIVEPRLPPGLNTIRTDPNQLELALLNLVLNSRDAMPQGGIVTLSARAERIASGRASQLPAGRYVCLAVADNGEGMDEETLRRASEPFFTTKGTNRGTGLGLSMIHGFMTQSGGQLILTSSRGKGTTVELWFPMETSEAKDASEQDAEPLGNAMGSLTVLVVDDHALVLMNAVMMLEDLGHTVLEANSGQKALEILRKKKIDLLVSDQAMPRMTGAQLIKAVKEEWPDLTAILCSGYAELPAGIELDVVQLAKPFRQEDLVRAITNAVGRKSSAARVIKFPAREK
jgi:PAS domain S-box-containing protein